MLCFSAGISIKNDRLCGDLSNVFNRAETARHINQLNVWLSFRCRITERRHPHGVELMSTSILMHYCVLNNKTSQTVMGFHSGNKALHLKNFLKPSPANVRHSQIGTGALFDIFILIISRIRILYKLAAIRGQYGNNLITDGLLEANAPIITVNNNIRMKLFKDRLV